MYDIQCAEYTSKKTHGGNNFSALVLVIPNISIAF